jgi:dTDP-4-amino-4,6-dideoxygalactose transaminase
VRTRNNIRELAIMTGEPFFKEKLYVGRPNIGDRKRFMERMEDILDRRWFTNNGPYVQEFEAKLASFVGVKHCIAMCNATIALEIAVRGLGLAGEVIVPSFTFIATAHSLQWQGITPVFCDIDPSTHNLDPVQIEKLITPKTTGIVGVHVWGRPCEIEALSRIADRHGLKLLFDAAHAFAGSHQGKMIGGFGDAEVFSFHATKFFNTFEGGAVTTDNDELARQIRLMKNFGFAGYDQVDFIGTNGKMTEVSAAMGLSSFERLDEFIDVNHRNFEHYKRELRDVPGIKLIDYSGPEKFNYQYIVIEIDEQITRIDRDRLVEILQAENVIARRYFYPGCHQMEPYHSHFPECGVALPHTERLVKRVMSLPTGTAVSLEDITAICGIIKLVLSNADQLAINAVSRA